MLLKVDGLLKAVLRNEIISWHKKKHDDSMQANSSVQSDMPRLANHVELNLFVG